MFADYFSIPILMFSPIFDGSSSLLEHFNSSFFQFPRVIELGMSTSHLVLNDIA